MPRLGVDVPASAVVVRDPDGDEVREEDARTSRDVIAASIGEASLRRPTDKPKLGRFRAEITADVSDCWIGALAGIYIYTLAGLPICTQTVDLDLTVETADGKRWHGKGSGVGAHGVYYYGLDGAVQRATVEAFKNMAEESDGGR